MNINDIRRQSRHYSKAEMIDYIAKVTGERPSASEFDSLMRRALPKESYYQERIMQAIREAYPAAFVWKAAAGAYSRQGIPDVCAIIGGKFYGFVVKRPYIGVLSKLQEQTIKAINEAGGEAAVVSWPEQVREVIEHGATEVGY